MAYNFPCTSGSPQLPLLTGVYISKGRYLLGQEISKGFSCRVYLATETSTGDEYAIKCLPRHREFTPEDRAQAQAAFLHNSASSSSERVVRLHETIFEEDHIFMVMDFHAGGTLQTAIDESQVYPDNPAMIKWTFLQLLDAVEKLHAQGIYHRNITPENVLVSEDCFRVFLNDFDLATDELEVNDFHVGSEEYMSPECINADGSLRSYSAKGSDIWSLATILFNMVTGWRPWRNAHPTNGEYASFCSDPELLAKDFHLTPEYSNLCQRLFHPAIKEEFTISKLKEELQMIGAFRTTCWHPISDERSLSSDDSSFPNTPLTSPADELADDVDALSLDDKKSKRRGSFLHVHKLAKVCKQIIAPGRRLSPE